MPLARLGATTEYKQDFGTGSLPSDWTAHGGTWTVSGSAGTGYTIGSTSWTVPGGVLTNSANVAAAINVYDTKTWTTNYTLRGSVRCAWINTGNRVGLVYNYVDQNNYYKVTISPSGGGIAHLQKVIGGTTTQDLTATLTGATYNDTGGNPHSNIWMDIEVVRNGGNTDVWIAGQHAFSGVSQSELGAGKIGVISEYNTDTGFDNISVSTNPVTDYSENFASGATGWTAQGSATFAASSGVYTNTTAGPTGFDLALYTSKTWATDYIYSAGLATGWGGNVQGVGVVYNYVDANNYYKVTVIPATGAVTLAKVVSGTTTTVATGSVPTGTATVSGVKSYRWLDLDVVRTADAHTSIIINGKGVALSGGGWMSDISQTELTGAGYVGVFSVWNPGQFDNITIASHARWEKPGFPKVAGTFYWNGYGVTSYQTYLSRFDGVVLDWYRDLGSGRTPPASLDTDISNIKGANPTIQIGNYSNTMESYGPTLSTGDASYDQATKLNGEKGPNYVRDWWAYTASGTRTTIHGGAPYDVNMSNFTIPDSYGYRYQQWYAQRQNTTIYDIWSKKFDFIFSDNCFYTPRTDPDYNGDGTDDLHTSSNAQTWWRQAMASYLTKVMQLNPDLPMTPNSDGDPSSSQGYFREPEYVGRVSGAYFEGALGKVWSYEHTANWQGMLASYRALMANTRAPHLVLLEVSGNINGAESYKDNNGVIQTGPTNWSFMRYGLASALMDDGYMCWLTFPMQTIKDSNGEYPDAANGYQPWFDEWDWYLGKALDAPPTSPDSNGLYWRHFENGIAVVNPKGNGTRTVTIPSGYARLLGTQDSTRNDGTTNAVSLPERDGLILRKL